MRFEGRERPFRAGGNENLSVAAHQNRHLAGTAWRRRRFEDTARIFNEVSHESLIGPEIAGLEPEVTMPEKTHKCAHPSCQCRVEEGEKYCSTYCHDAGDTIEISCNCDHPGCSLAEAV
jgi:hypothetical protein